MLNILHKNKKGFSLIELIVAIAVLVVLVVVLIPQYKKSANKAKEKADLALVENLQSIVTTSLQDTALKRSDNPQDTDKPINMYELSKDKVNKSTSKNLVVEFYATDGIVYPVTVNCTIDGKNDVEIRGYLADIIKEQVKPLELESDLYKVSKFTMTYTFPDADKKVKMELGTSETNFLLGDVNSDGTVNDLDSDKLQKYVQLNQDELTINLAACDTTKDGKIDESDLTKLKNMVKAIQAAAAAEAESK